MWKSVLAGIILENIESLNHYQSLKDKKGSAVDNILQFVTNAVTSLPWYFRFPVRTLAGIIGLACLIATGRKLNVLPSEQRSSFIRRVRYVPFFDMLNKLVRSMAFLKLFDCVPSAPDFIHNVKTESN